MPDDPKDEYIYPYGPPPSPLPNGAARRSFGVKRGRVKARQHAEQKAQAALMMTQRLSGRSYGEIARMFNTTTGTVKKRLSIPELQEFFATAKEVVATRLLPLALEVMNEKLEQGDGDMAKEVIFGTGILSKNVNIAATIAPVAPTDDFDSWRRKRLEAASEVAAVEALTSAAEAALDADVEEHDE